MPVGRKCQDPTHVWDDRARRCKTCRSKLDRDRWSAGNGGTECTLNYDDWCRSTGFNPATGQYDRPPQDVPRPFVSGFDRKQEEL